MSAVRERLTEDGRVTLSQRGKTKIYTADFYKDGRHCRLSLKTRNVKIARERAMKLEVSLQEGTHRPTPPAITVEAACKNFLSYLKTEGRSGKTQNNYENAFTLWRKFLARNGIHRLHQITASHFDRFRAERSAKRKPSTVYLDGILIKAFLRWAKTRKLLWDDPLVEVRVKRPTLQVKFCPTLGQVNAVLAVAPEPLRSQWATLAYTGMRAGDLQRLRPQDINWAGNWIDIVSRPGAETKSRQSRRVPIHPRLRPILEALPKSPREFLFTTATDDPRPICLRRLNRKLQALLSQLDLPAGREFGFVVHSFRHFFETQSVNSGVPQPIIDRWLGHKPDPTVMSNVYYTLDDPVSQEKMLLVDFDDTVLVDPPATAIALPKT